MAKPCRAVQRRYDEGYFLISSIAVLSFFMPSFDIHPLATPSIDLPPFDIPWIPDVAMASFDIVDAVSILLLS